MSYYVKLGEPQLRTFRISRLFTHFASMAGNYADLDEEDIKNFEAIGCALRSRTWAEKCEFYRSTSFDTFMLRLYEVDIMGLPTY